MLTKNTEVTGTTPISIGAILSARERLARIAVRPPLLRFDGGGERGETYLKLENLQPIASFRLRGAAHSMALASREALAHA